MSDCETACAAEDLFGDLDTHIYNSWSDEECCISVDKLEGTTNMFLQFNNCEFEENHFDFVGLGTEEAQSANYDVPDNTVSMCHMNFHDSYLNALKIDKEQLRGLQQFKHCAGINAFTEYNRYKYLFHFIPLTYFLNQIVPSSWQMNQVATRPSHLVFLILWSLHLKTPKSLR
jgi:hypothetical protein